MAINLDFLKNLVAKNQTQDYPIIPLIQVNEQGGLETDPLKMAQAELGLKQASTPLTLGDRFFGREMTQDYQTVNPDTNEAEMTTISNYRPGFFNDLASGYRENATQGFDVNNLAPQRKGLATRIGEGLGTLARFYDKPIGRMAVATGLSMLTDEANPLGEGVKAYVGRQTNMTKDKAYRQGLINMGVDEAQVNAIPGIVSDDVFSNIARAKQLQDYALYRQDMIDTQRENARTLNNYRMAQLAEDVKQNELENYYKGQQLAQGWEKINLDKDNKNKGKPLSDSQVKELNNTQQFLTALDNISDRYNNAKYDKLFGVGGDIKRNLPTSRYDADVSLFKQDVEILRQRYAKLLEGGRLSDSDRVFYQKALFNPNTSRKDFLEAIRRMKETLKQDYSNSLSMYQKQGKDISEFEMPSSFNSTPQTNTNVTTIKAKLKEAGYSNVEINEYLKAKGLQ